MTVNQKIKKDQLIFLGMALVGFIALFIGFVLQIEKDTMIGISCGFIPTGIGGWIIYSYASKNQQMLRNIESEIDERNQFIGYRAAYASFWTIYGYIFFLTIFSKFISISLSSLCIFTLIFMSVVFFLFRFIYSRIY